MGGRFSALNHVSWLICHNLMQWRVQLATMESDSWKCPGSISICPVEPTIHCADIMRTGGFTHHRQFNRPDQSEKELTDSRHALQQLNQLTWDTIASRRDKLSGRQVVVPPLQPLEDEQVESRFAESFPVLAYLERALTLAAEHELSDIATGFAAIVGELRWSQNPAYDETTCSAEFLNGYAYAGFSGPDSPIRCTVPRGGLMIMAPELTYPGHKHEPMEVYLVLTPGAQWQLDEGEWFDVVPGDLILHQSWQVHSMRTGGDPLLAFAGWVSDGARRSINWSGSDVLRGE